ncbi:MAG TPA: NAD(P)H-quinone oxidoreductase [Acidimicrobiia bacterium]|nr:NAD(P)H-quinone oxidoreductase [Acidimicrobiia bacterium]
MRALVIAEGGRLVVEERPVPEPGAGQVLVRVSGAGINRADLLQRAGRYPAPPGAPADIPGLEFAGVIEAAGDGVVSPCPGERVMGIVAGGGQAEYLVTEAAHCARVPGGLDLVDAGGIPEAFITAHDAMVVQGGLMSGQRVLIHAVASGVGTAALQLACSLGATVAGTSRSKDKLERAVELGLHHPVPAPSGFEPAALAEEITTAAGGSMDVTVDLLGGPYLGVDVAAAGPKGRIVIVGLIAGRAAELDMGALLAKRLVVRGTVLRSRPSAEKADATHLFEGQVVPLIAGGAIRPVIDELVPLAEAERAYDLVAADRTFGKVVLDLR